MIQIFQNKNLSDSRMKEIEEWFSECIKKIVYKKTKKVDLEIKKSYKLIEKTLKDYKEYLTLSLEGIKKAIKDNAMPLISNDEKNKLISLYGVFRDKYGAELCEKLEISVCPYCNRNYINAYNGNKTTAEFDHFFNKSTYPIFAISLYNLIQCCHDCNHLKGEKSLNISPYNYTYTTDNLLTFSYRLLDCSGNLKTTINTMDKLKLQDLDLLKLESKYQIHNNYVREIIEKTRLYPKIYFSSEIAKKLNMTEEEIFLGNYLSESNYYKRPLSKLTHDINNEIKKYIFDVK